MGLSESTPQRISLLPKTKWPPLRSPRLQSQQCWHGSKHRLDTGHEMADPGSVPAVSERDMFTQRRGMQICPPTQKLPGGEWESDCLFWFVKGKDFEYDTLPLFCDFFSFTNLTLFLTFLKLICTCLAEGRENLSLLWPPQYEIFRFSTLKAMLHSFYTLKWQFQNHCYDSLTYKVEMAHLPLTHCAWLAWHRTIYLWLPAWHCLVWTLSHFLAKRCSPTSALPAWL